jgi:hypothetical protein
VGLTPVLGGGGIFSCRSNRWGGGQVWGITGSLLLVLAVYRGGGLKLCVNLVGGCVDSAVRNILLPRKNYRTVTAPPQQVHT